MGNLVQLTKPICNEMNPGGRTHVQSVVFLHRVLMSLNAYGISIDVKTAKMAEQTWYRLACVGFFSWIFITLKNENILIIGLDPLVQELSHLFCSVGCGFGLLWGNIAECRENYVIDGNGVIHKSASHLLNEGSPLIWEILCCVQRVRILDLLSILDWGTGMWRVLFASSEDVL